MNKTKALVCGLVIVLVLLSATNVVLYNQITYLNRQNDEFRTRSEMLSILDQLQFQLDSELRKLDHSLLTASQQFSTVSLHGDEARAVLDNLVASSPYIINAATVDKNGVIVAAGPSEYRRIEGMYVGDQDQMIMLQQTRRPVMSNVIRLVEGFDDAFMATPIFTVDGTFAGSLSVVFDPATIIEATVTPLLSGTPYTTFAIQLDGRSIYDHDPAQLGKILFSDPVYQDYPELVNLGRRVVAEKSGYGTYEFYKTLESNEVVKKEVYWTTIGIHDTEWRLVILHVMSE
jgi:hypothetical protein